MKNLKIFTDNIEEKARKQIDLLLEQDAFKDCKVRIMPDVHAGAGCVIGFTADLGDKVIPNVVGVDIGCGMLCATLEETEIDLKLLDKVIRENIPSGMNARNEALKTEIKLSELDEIVNDTWYQDGDTHTMYFAEIVNTRLVEK
jgi:RNA-splicing ligase RtcB